jgi:hypothetical protein
MGQLYLVYSEKITDNNSRGLHEYELYFSEAPELVWGEDWNASCPAACGKEGIRPDESTYQAIKRLECSVPFNCISENTCFSCQDMIDQIVACMWEDISDYDEYPEPSRLVFKFGETHEDIVSKLEERSLGLEQDE